MLIHAMFIYTVADGHKNFQINVSLKVI